MVRAATLLFFLLIFNSAFSQSDKDQPKLVVGVVVDQMRQEFLSRFYDHFGEGGFKRLMNEGYSFKNAHYNYKPTSTGPGHASIYTGTTPRMHGIIENDWYDKPSQKKINCVEDRGVSNVGGSPKGKRSPKNLLTTTFTDELRLFYQNRSKVVSVSIKDRGAILPGGHNPTGAYWYDEKSGEFMTSTYYEKELPDWVKKFNEQKKVEQYMNQEWNTFFPIEKYIESDRDNRNFEKPKIKTIEPVFPYDLIEMCKSIKPSKLIPYTPFGNSLILDMSLAALEAESLGDDQIPDVLAISFSSTDKIGHDYGPYSKEIQDTYVRLDRDIERLLNALDEKVGKGQWTLFLTSDHGVADIPNSLKEKKFEFDYWAYSKIEPAMKEWIESKYDATGLVEKIMSGQVYFDRKIISEQKLNLADVKRTTIDYLKEIEGISGAYDINALHAYDGGQQDISILAAGLHPIRSGDIIFTLLPGWLGENYKDQGTGHGSHYSYDTHVPMIFYGKGIVQGSSVKYQPITNIAPTISTLLEIKLPSGCTGQPIAEVLGEK